MGLTRGRVAASTAESGRLGYHNRPVEDRKARRPAWIPDAFRLITSPRCEEKASVAIASNETFSGWTKTFTDPSLCAAIVDWLTFDGHIIKTPPTPTDSSTPGPREVGRVS